MIENLIVSMENISADTDKTFIYPFINEISKLVDNYKTTLNDESVTFNGKKMSAKQIDKLKELFRQTSINKNINNICNILSKRFGVMFELSVHYNGGEIANIITPPLDFKTLGIALEDLDSLFPKKQMNQLLWSTIASSNEKKVYDTLKDITTALKKNKLKVNLAKGYIEGLNNSSFVINFDMLTAFVNNLNPDEIAAILLHEVGHVFTYVEHLYYSTKNTLVLLDSFIYEKFDKGKGDKESITIALNDAGVEVKKNDLVGLLQGIDMFTLKTYKIDLKKGNMQIDFERQADQFVNRLGLGSELASALVKISSFGTIQPEAAENDDNFFIKLLKIFSIIISTILFLILTNVVGLIILILLFGFKAISYVIGMILNVIGVFIKTVTNSKENTYNYDDLTKRLRKIKLDLIRQLRKASKNEINKYILVEQIDAVKNSIDLINERFSIVKRYGETIGNLNTTDNRELVNEMLEILEENDGYYYAEKFQDLLKQNKGVNND